MRTFAQLVPSSLLLQSHHHHHLPKRTLEVTSHHVERSRAQAGVNRYRGREGSRGSRDSTDLQGERVPLYPESHWFVAVYDRPLMLSEACALTHLPNSSQSTGYSRIILAGVALHFMSYHPKYCTIAYGISCLLDAADGHAARMLGQSSKFGAVLDMVTDRCAHSYDAF